MKKKKRRIRNKKAFEVAKASEQIPLLDRLEWMKLYRPLLQRRKHR